MNSLVIERYENLDAVYHPYDSRAPQIAGMLARALEQRQPRLQVEHIGSTAVPECGGKGIIDLAVTYSPGDLEIAKTALDDLGFQRQAGRDPFPETRPMRVGAIAALGGAFQIHAHVIERDGEEHRTLAGFRDSLRRHPALRRAYEEDKRRILESGLTDSLDYCNAKSSFIAAAVQSVSTVK